MGDPSKAFKKLNWEPKITLEELISEMIQNDLQEAMKESLLKKEGFVINNQKN